ncbi:phosphocholine cytidylyltransferase family protein [Brevibacillus formosus]|uniref:Cholinephosphate cytidylyltransferase n=1 Tax=Brevibacillus formosus TaxID=54913 RepID=A0A837KKC5_9BACL|nr:phosphocholine cytidylyltransferase family protein [Brevibacillus formosus]KLH97894.1 cholinephosphate cytidylyltransferase [Brevibacillus formosus]MBG9942490.1 cholinephosphate cytidylyltransferase [Brevibacillus formosus]MBW5470125.1 NTP transferase domain-containing protein [Brevibacillus formosus]MED1957293.1 phosphocholine cytidylyltransferase family protein [Brevibacillus formosus]PSJ98690.1 phosphocholine cytidylyltransferase family protein [Brevibacillus formosus]
MKALLMAAGLGSRINEQIDGIPKCTVDIGNQALIENTIAELRRHRIEEIAMVVGYQANVITKLLRDESIRFYHNPFYDRTNSMVSLWFAREFLQGDDCLLLNADVYFESRVLEVVLQETACPVMYADPVRRYEGDYKFGYENGLLLRHGKELSLEETTGEYVGIAKVQESFLPIFLRRLQRLIQEKQYDLWWENVLYSFLGERNVYVTQIPPGLFWAEVDTWEDYRRILQFTNHLAHR